MQTYFLYPAGAYILQLAAYVCMVRCLLQCSIHSGLHPRQGYWKTMYAAMHSMPHAFNCHGMACARTVLMPIPSHHGVIMARVPHRLLHA